MAALIRLLAISAETLQVGRWWQNIFEVIKVENLQPRKLPSNSFIQTWRDQKF